MIRRIAPAAAFLATGCILEDPYAIADPVRPEANDAPGQSAQEPAPASEPEQPVSEPEPPRPMDILTEPDAPPAPLEPEPVGAPAEPVDAPTSVPNPIDEAPEPAQSAGGSPADAGAFAECGNGVLEGAEACDGEDLAGRSCYSRGFGGGLLRCSAECDLDTGECLPGPTCKRHAGSAMGIVYEGTLREMGDDSSAYSCSEGGGGADDLSVSWTAPSTGCFEFTVSSPDAINMVVALFDECSLAAELACGAEDGFYEDAVVQFDVVANTTYALVVDTFDAGGAAEMTVRIDACAGDPEEMPDEWICLATRYGGDQGCDCGCGAFDPDCADESVDSCDNCGPIDSCSDSDCELLDPDRNWRCDD